MNLTIVSCNVHAGGSRGLDALLGRLFAHAPDVMCLSETLPGSVGRWHDALGAVGYVHRWWHPTTDAKCKGLLMASMVPMAEVDDAPPFPQRWRHLVHTCGLHLLVAHLWTGEREPRRKIEQWRWMNGRVAGLNASGQRWLLIGDLNTGDRRDRHSRAPRYTGEDEFVTLTTLGTDLWRRRHDPRTEWTWFSAHARKHHHADRGFRLDHAFADASTAASCTACDYDHGVRLDGLTDHSAVVVRVSV